MSQERTFFAITSLGKNRWYWVVWPSLNQLELGEATTQLADGICSTKAEAIDAALEVAGIDGEWLAAKYAKGHYQTHRSVKATNVNSEQAFPLNQEYLYNDQLADDLNTWCSVPYRIVKKTKRYVYIEQQPYRATQRTGSWLDHAPKTFRLDRLMLEKEGYAFLPMMDELPSGISDPIFFTTSFHERVGEHEGIGGDALSILGLSLPCTVADVKSAYRRLAKQLHPDRGGNPTEFLKLQQAYRRALLLCQQS